MSSSEIFNPFNFDIIDIDSFYCKSAHKRVKKNVGIPNTLYKNFPVGWSTLNGIHETVCLVSGNKLIDSFFKLFT